MSKGYLIMFVGRQVWPHLHVALHLAPRRILLLHTDDAAESAGPADRLCELLRDPATLEPSPDVETRCIRGDHLAGTARALEEVAVQDEAVTLNVTGGTKLMAFAAAEWVRTHPGVQMVYFERDRHLQWLGADDGSLSRLKSEAIDPHRTDFIDPARLVTCQCGNSIVRRAGQLISLKDEGVRERAERALSTGSPPASDYLELVGESTGVSKEGDRLEFRCALAVLLAGVPLLSRGLELAVDRVGSGAHGECDLVFSWGGRLWIVDCKDRRSTAWLTSWLRKARRALPNEEPEAPGRIADLLARSPYKAIKDDLLAAREMGGLDARIIAVRKTLPADDVLRYAQAQGVSIVRSRDLLAGIRRVLRSQ